MFSKNGSDKRNRRFSKSENHPTLSITPVVASWLYKGVGEVSLSTLGGAREARGLK